MKFNELFNHVVYLNLTKHDTRRRHTENELLDAGIPTFARISAFSGKWVNSCWRGYPTALRYAQALSHKYAIWTAWRRKVPTILVFEDDVIINKDTIAAFSDMELPSDWAVFLLGCQHRARPKVVGPGIVRCTSIWDMHAYAIRASAYPLVTRALLPYGKAAPVLAGTGLHSCDEQLSQLCSRIPVYAVWPNIAWQRQEKSEAQPDWINNNYTTSGQQLHNMNAVADLSMEMLQFSDDVVARRTFAAAKSASQRAPLLLVNTLEDVGLGDRLRGLASLRVLAKLTGQFPCVRWRSGDGLCDGEHDDILEGTGYRVIMKEREWNNLLQNQGQADTLPCNMMPTELSEVIKMRGLHDCLPEVDMLQSWTRAARDIRPARSIQERINGSVAAWRVAKPVGLHIRSTDAKANPKRWSPNSVMESRENVLRNRIVDLCAGQPDAAVYLACDDALEFQRWNLWCMEVGIRVLSTQKVWRAGKVRQTSLEDAAVDLFLLSRCDYILASIWSSFSWYASILGDIKYEVAADVGGTGDTAHDVCDDLSN